MPPRKTSAFVYGSPACQAPARHLLRMSSFPVQARRVTISEHPNADAIELAHVDAFVSIVRKGDFQTGDLAVYLPEQALLPESLILELGLYERDEDGQPLYDEKGLRGKLAGPERNRIKPMRLRGIFSQGILYRPDFDLEEGQDYAQVLGVTKWVPPVPIHMAGELKPFPGLSSYTDIENIKRYPDFLQAGEEVVAVEKCHGTATVHVFVKGQGFAVSSKGFAGQGLGLVDAKNERGQSTNVYWRAAHAHDVAAKLERFCIERGAGKVTLYGETFGVQDLKYGLQNGAIGFAAFDLKVDDQYLDYDEFVAVAEALDLPLLPLLYRGPFSDEAVWAAASGREQVTGQEAHIREGVVVRPVKERYDLELGRVILKAVSEDYLLRRNKDATEFE